MTTETERKALADDLERLHRVAVSCPLAATEPGASAWEAFYAFVESNNAKIVAALRAPELIGDQRRVPSEEEIARALHEAHKPWCDYTYPFEDPMAGRLVYEALARAVLALLSSPPPLVMWKPAADMSDNELSQAIGELTVKWDDLIKDAEGHGGSPMEWLDERLSELEFERQRRASLAGG